MKPRSRRDKLLKRLLLFLLILKLKLKLKLLLLGQRLLLLKEVRLLTRVLMDRSSLHLQIILQSKLSFFFFFFSIISKLRTMGASCFEAFISKQ